MFIRNFKMNGIKIYRIIFIIMIILLVFILIKVFCIVFNGAWNSGINQSCIPQNNVYKISPNNYSNILKAVHENIDKYIGTKINFTGYIYRVYDLNDNQFILARDMIVSKDFKSIIVGFLCEYNKANKFKDGTWVEITGEIKKGNYHGDMPIVQITNIKNIDIPNEEYVYPPDDNYIITDNSI